MERDIHRAHGWEVFCVSLIDRTLKVAPSPWALTFKDETNKLGLFSWTLFLRPAHMEISLSSICISKYPRALPLVFPSAGRILVLLVQINCLSSMKYNISGWLHVTEWQNHTTRTLSLKPSLNLNLEATLTGHYYCLVFNYVQVYFIILMVRRAGRCSW